MSTKEDLFIAQIQLQGKQLKKTLEKASPNFFSEEKGGSMSEVLSDIRDEIILTAEFRSIEVTEEDISFAFKQYYPS